MQIRWTDFNGAGNCIASTYYQQWGELEQVLTTMPLHLKASDQNGIQGTPIFDPVGTNNHIATALQPLSWSQGIPIPSNFTFLGTGIDFGKNGTIVEAQFSNYPYLLNNALRSELFYRAQTIFHNAPTGLLVFITKGGMFPASQSTLYYEQAFNQLNALVQNNVFSVPIRLVGLFESPGPVQAVWSEYAAARHSRTLVSRTTKQFTILNGQISGTRCSILSAPVAQP